MKKLLALLLANCLMQIAHCQLNYWQQQVNFRIDVTLNDKDHTLDAFERLEYINNSPDTLKFIWFHLWPNAYKNDKTAYTDQTLENGITKFYFSNKEDKGYINRLDFKVNNVTAVLEDHPQYIDIAKLVLPVPLPPGQKITITTPFHEKLPYNFSRGGHDGQSYQVTQWFPKPAVYDKKGWHPMPYLDQGEFYSEYGNFEVNITVPKNYVVAATGELQNQEEKDWLETRSSFAGKYSKTKIVGADPHIAAIEFPASSTEIKTIQFKQNNVHDFAWFADKRFVVKHDKMKLESGRAIDVYAYYYHADYKAWQNAVQSEKNAIAHYSGLVGEYPYNIVSVVEGPESFGGGMEYPTITVISPTADVHELELTIVHEVGHNWFYGILGSNERDHPWMDEGINSYYDQKYDLIHYKKLPRVERVAFETKAVTHLDQPIELPSEKFNEANYDLVAYYKTAEWLRYLESVVGTEAYDKAMHEYYRRWQFKHPQPEDFKQVMEESTGKDLDSIFSYQNKTGLLPNQQRKGTTFKFGLSRDFFMNGPDLVYKNQIIFAPLAGFNTYDKFMIGGFLSNMRLPPNRLQFFVAGMYATSSKKFRGIGTAYYSFYPNTVFRKIELGVNGSSFSMDKYVDSAGRNVFLGFQKIVPGIKFTFKEKPRSNRNRYIQFKSFLINEDALRFYRDTVIVGIDTSINEKYKVIKENRTLNQLRFVIENIRVLYPYRGELRLEQGKDFFRMAFIGNYFFNYPKEGGLNVRLFAGKFFYSGAKTFTKQFATDRYHLNMTGANGYEDYTYSDYFIGRNKFDGILSQQIMMRDGAFKVRTDLLADKIGKTDDWLMAANFTTTVPSEINPLSILPIKIPLKVFADIGTNAEAWKQKADNDRFLYDAGLQLSFFNETIKIYYPLIYSSVYKDYIQSTIAKNQRFTHKISFSIDISNFNVRKIDRNLVF